MGSISSADDEFTVPSSLRTGNVNNKGRGIVFSGHQKLQINNFGPQTDSDGE